MHRRRFLLTGLALVLSPAALLACLWDYDTLKQERARFPSTLELITGKFLRHSKEFYEWRIEARLKKLKADPNNVAYYDDLAVAYQKTGQHAKAIETILEKETIKPGLYETYSNLGTFHILAGDLEKGLPYIDKALAINPNAHFGREKYQKWLVEYALTRKKDGKITFPLRGKGADFDNFRRFLSKGLGSLSKADTKEAVHAILGMMRFANHDNPLLLEALGDLLYEFGNESSDGKQLAARAYLQASYQFKEEAVQEQYRKFAQTASKFQTPDGRTHHSIELENLKSQFAVELNDAEQWYGELRQKEIDWIKAGKDVDAEFDKLYATEPHVVETDPPAPPFWTLHGWGFVSGLLSMALFVALITAVVGMTLIVGLTYLRRQSRHSRPRK